VAIKKSDLYSSLWESCDALRGSMDASQYKDYVLVMLFIKYVSDKAGSNPYESRVPDGATFTDMVALKGNNEIGNLINTNIISPLRDAYGIQLTDFNDTNKLGSGKELVDRLTNLIATFENKDLDFASNRAANDDLLGDAYEYLMRNFATESGKSKGQFYTPSEVSRIMAQVLGVAEANTSPDMTVYDPTCGSGSLLLKVADAATTDLTLYGQEMDNQTAGLARMNMVLHDNDIATIESGNSTLATPKFKDGEQLKTFDYVVANPPFSDKRWTTGLNPDEDPYDRFNLGVPPGKQGDYAYLLHIVRSLKSTGKAACILPHGVLFRGNAEAGIRENLVRSGLIEGIIGLPANLFYGTGIPACIIVMNKKDTQARRGIYMIDASKGFVKDGNKNRLRERDIHRIVDAWQGKEEIEKFARMVGMNEIVANDYNLNLPRYISTAAAEDKQDIEAHLKGGMPEVDIEAMSDYWSVCPSLRAALFVDERPGYHRLAIAAEEIQSTIAENDEFKAFNADLAQHYEAWKGLIEPQMRALAAGLNPKRVIADWSEGLLEHYESRALIDPYAIYQHIMDYWEEVLQDDLYQIAADGWKAETYRIIEKNQKGKEVDKGWACDLLPKPLLVARYYIDEQAEIDALTAKLETLAAEKMALEEEHGNDGQALHDVSNAKSAKDAFEAELLLLWKSTNLNDYQSYIDLVGSREAAVEAKNELAAGPLISSLANDKGNVTQKAVNAAIKSTTDEDDLSVFNRFNDLSKSIASYNKVIKEQRSLFDDHVNSALSQSVIPDDYADLLIIKKYQNLVDQEATTKKALKAAEAALDEATYAHYPLLEEAEVMDIVVSDKWLVDMRSRIDGEAERVTQTLTQRVKQLAERYAEPMPQLAHEVSALEQKVQGHLEKMGFSWT
jgi:type I restriction enzyme M protein